MPTAVESALLLPAVQRPNACPTGSGLPLGYAGLALAPAAAPSFQTGGHGGGGGAG